MTTIKKKRIKPRSAKNKGKKFQNWLAEKISEFTGFPCGKDEEIESRQMGQSGTDVRLSKTALTVFPYSVEAKHQENWSIPQWIEQAKENQIKGTDWLLFCKKNRKDPIVVMDAERFFELIKKQ